MNRLFYLTILTILITASFLLRTQPTAPDNFSFDAAQLTDKTTWT